MKNRHTLLAKNLIPAYAYTAITALAYLFSRFYTVFTHDETSEAISLLWLFLLFSGMAFFVLAAIVFTIAKRQPRRIALAVYSSGVVTFAAGLFIRGVLEIFGADRSLIRYYEIAGIALMAIGFILIAVFSQPYAQKKTMQWPKSVKILVRRGIPAETAIRALVKCGEITQEEAEEMICSRGI
ncbi:MAG: DUF2871 family protein [Oscillospiraceae bacterium]|jgi:hypothetical protein|nr:DUF2871 family protein [Oscillospiraceae bacterium]